MKDKLRGFLGFLGLIEDEYGEYGSTGSAPARPFTDSTTAEVEPEWTAPPTSARLSRRYCGPEPAPSTKETMDERMDQ